MSSSWQSNPLIKEEIDPEILSSMTTVLETPDAVDLTRVFPPFECNKLKTVKSKASGLSLNLILNRHSYSNNDSVDGKLNIFCSNKALKLGRIEIRLLGYEETYPNKKFNTRRMFLNRLLSIQNSNTSASCAVFPCAADQDHMWPARMGKNSIPFDIAFTPSPQDPSNPSGGNSGLHIPSSFWHKKLGGIRYILAGIVYAKSGEKLMAPVATYRHISFFEHSEITLSSNWFTPVKPAASAYMDVKRGIFNLGKKGLLKISMHPCTPKTVDSLESGIWIAGSPGYINLLINNGTHKDTCKIHVALIRRIKTFKEIVSDDGKSMIPLDLLREPVCEKKFIFKRDSTSAGKYIMRNPSTDVNVIEGNDYQVKSGDSQSLMLELDIPPKISTIRFGSLIDVSFVLHLTVYLKGGKSLTTETPIRISNLNSLMKCSPSLDYKLVQESSEAPNVLAIPLNNEVHATLDMPADLTKEETLISTSQADFSSNSFDSESGSKIQEIFSTPSRNSTVGSRRIDSIRFKEKMKSSKNSTFRSRDIPTPPPPPSNIKNTEKDITTVEDIEKMFEAIM